MQKTVPFENARFFFEQSFFCWLQLVPPWRAAYVVSGAAEGIVTEHGSRADGWLSMDS